MSPCRGEFLAERQAITGGYGKAARGFLGRKPVLRGPVGSAVACAPVTHGLAACPPVDEGGLDVGAVGEQLAHVAHDVAPKAVVAVEFGRGGRR